jgi:putative transposase
MNVRWRTTRYAVYNCSYHIIFCPKYRRKILVGNIEKRLKEILNETARENSWIIDRMEVMPDHVHIFIKVPPIDPPAHVVAQMKGKSSYILRREFPELTTRLPNLWTRSYYVETIGHISEAAVQKYIEDQKKK